MTKNMATLGSERHIRIGESAVTVNGWAETLTRLVGTLTFHVEHSACPLARRVTAPNASAP